MQYVKHTDQYFKHLELPQLCSMHKQPMLKSIFHEQVHIFNYKQISMQKYWPNIQYYPHF